MWLARLFSEKSRATPSEVITADSSDPIAAMIQHVLKASWERTGVTRCSVRRSNAVGNGPAVSHGGAADAAAAPADGRPPESATNDVSAMATRSHARAGFLIGVLLSRIRSLIPLSSPRRNKSSAGSPP